MVSFSFSFQSPVREPDYCVLGLFWTVLLMLGRDMYRYPANTSNFVIMHSSEVKQLQTWQGITEIKTGEPTGVFVFTIAFHATRWIWTLSWR